MQIWINKQQIHSVGLGRLAEEYNIPLYFQLPIVQEWGTGVSIGEDLILTNYHVVQGARDLGIQTPESEIVPAQIVKVLPDLDLAWLRLDKELPLEIWSSEVDIQKNETVWTGGFATELTWSEKKGVITDIGRKDILLDEKQNFAIFDQVVEPGYSGGPVWNEERKLIGIMTATNREKKQSYFIPIKEVSEFWKHVQTDNIHWGELGIEVSEQQIVSVNPYSPAKNLPLGKIEQINGQNVSAKLLDAELRRLQIGQKVVLTIDGKEYSILLQDFSEWGSTDENTCFWNKASLKRETDGWKVVSLQESSPLRELGARPNDLLQINETCEQLFVLDLKLIPVKRGKHTHHIILPKHYQR